MATDKKFHFVNASNFAGNDVSKTQAVNALSSYFIPDRTRIALKGMTLDRVFFIGLQTAPSNTLVSIHSIRQLRREREEYNSE